VNQRLFHVTAELAHLAGWMAYDQGLLGVAQRYYLLGLSACREARSPVFGAKIPGSMTQLSTAYRHDEDSLDLVRAALYILPRHDSALVRTELLGLESRVHVHLGDQAAATRATDACVEVWQEAQSESAPGWMRYMNQAEVDCLAANSYIELALRTEDRGHAIVMRSGPSGTPTAPARAGRPATITVALLTRFDSPRSGWPSLTSANLSPSRGRRLSWPHRCPRSWSVIGSSRFHGELIARYPDDAHVIPFTEQLHEYVKRVAPHKERDIAAA
jgi:hypothetical protein